MTNTTTTTNASGPCVHCMDCKGCSYCHNDDNVSCNSCHGKNICWHCSIKMPITEAQITFSRSVKTVGISQIDIRVNGDDVADAEIFGHYSEETGKLRAYQILIHDASFNSQSHWVERDDFASWQAALRHAKQTAVKMLANFYVDGVSLVMLDGCTLPEESVKDDAFWQSSADALDVEPAGITVTITAVDESSCLLTAGGVDADVSYDGQHVCSVCLVPLNATGDNQASDQLSLSTHGIDWHVDQPSALFAIAEGLAMTAHAAEVTARLTGRYGANGFDREDVESDVEIEFAPDYFSRLLDDIVEAVTVAREAMPDKLATFANEY